MRIELHLGGEALKVRHSRAIKAMGGTYSACRGHRTTRYVTLPGGMRGVRLAIELIELYGSRRWRDDGKLLRTTAIFRGPYRFKAAVEHIREDLVEESMLHFAVKYGRRIGLHKRGSADQAKVHAAQAAESHMIHHGSLEAGEALAREWLRAALG